MPGLDCGRKLVGVGIVIQARRAHGALLRHVRGVPSVGIGVHIKASPIFEIEIPGFFERMPAHGGAHPAAGATSESF
jgi:hypothetical protein